MEAVPPPSGLRKRARQTVEFGDWGHGSVKRRVEAGNLRQRRMKLPQGLDGLEVVGLVQGRQGHQSAQSVYYCVGE